jgi:hypothetical protein
MSYPTAEDLADYYAGRGELRERPADVGDFRFEITAWDEPEMGCTHTVRMIDDHGAVVEHYTTDDPYGHVEQFRQFQEEGMSGLESFGPEWEREQSDRLNYV